MINYEAGVGASCKSWHVVWTILNMRVFQLAFIASISGACISGVMNTFEHELGLEQTLGGETALFGSFTGVMGFLFVFRMAQSYARFDRGSDLVFEMCADFFDGTAILFSLARSSNADDRLLENFYEKSIRLVSLLCAVCYEGLSGAEEIIGTEDPEQKFAEWLHAVSPGVIDVCGLDIGSLQALARSRCRPELVYQMLQNLMVDHLDTVLDVPAPLLTRVFQELGNGMIKYHEAFKLVHVPYPFPLMALSEFALFLHWLVCPLIVAVWCKSWLGSVCFTFMVEFILWSMVALAAEFDFPFGSDVNDIDMRKVQKHLNHSLASLVENAVLPSPHVDTMRKMSISADDYEMARGPRKRVSVSRGWHSGVGMMPDQEKITSIVQQTRSQGLQSSTVTDEDQQTVGLGPIMDRNESLLSNRRSGGLMYFSQKGSSFGQPVPSAAEQLPIRRTRWLSMRENETCAQHKREACEILGVRPAHGPWRIDM